MKIVCQKQIWNEYGYDRFIASLTKIGQVDMVDVIPFTTVVEPDIFYIPDLVFGSGRMVDIARNRGWPTFGGFPPVFFTLIDQPHWVNGNGWISTLGDLNFKKYEEVFIKPAKEKLFTGTVVSSKEPLDCQIQFSTSTSPNLNDELVWVSPPKRLGQENRFFVVGGRIVTGSVYKVNGRGKYKEITSEDYEWGSAYEILKSLPEDFVGVVDTTLVDGDSKIVEFNNLNSAGVYDIDTDALAKSLSLYVKWMT